MTEGSEGERDDEGEKVDDERQRHKADHVSRRAHEPCGETVEEESGDEREDHIDDEEDDQREQKPAECALDIRAAERARNIPIAMKTHHCHVEA